MRLVREALYLSTLGNITSQERYRVYSILEFAMHQNAPGDGEPCPLETPAEIPSESEEAVSPQRGACQLGCAACDEGGRMVEDDY